MAPGKAALAVDLDPVHLRMAKLNAEVYEAGDAVTAVHADVRDVDLAGVDAVFVDPARRLGDRRLGGGQSEPPLDWCLSTPRHKYAGIRATLHPRSPRCASLTYDLRVCALGAPCERGAGPLSVRHPISATEYEAWPSGSQQSGSRPRPAWRTRGSRPAGSWSSSPTGAT
ncbi:MAG: hypothetical protein ACRDYX_17815 [Egibacteraceae bacterium]